MTSPPTGPAHWHDPSGGPDGEQSAEPSAAEPSAAEPSAEPSAAGPSGVTGPWAWQPAAPNAAGSAAEERSSLAMDAVVAVLAGLVIAALGAPLGWLWAALAPRIPVVRVEGGFTYADAEPEQVIGADGWFMLLGAGAGIVVAVTVWLALRRWRGPLMVIGVVLGSLAASWLAWWVGRQVGLAEFERLRDTATVGTRLLAPLGLRSTDFAAAEPWTPLLNGVMAMQALAAAFVYTCCAGWSRFSSLRGPDPEPEYPPYQAYPFAPTWSGETGPVPNTGAAPDTAPGPGGPSAPGSGPPAVGPGGPAAP